MALKIYEPGDVVFLKLEGDFVPAWRQGLVASVSRKKGTIYLVVRVLDKELENKESGLTSFDLEQNKFILMKKQPLKHVKRYVREIKEQLGATNETPFSLSDWSKRINWGKNKSLMRLHYGMSEVLETLLKGKSEQAALQLTNLLRATHQCSLDGGNWKVAWLLTHLADPLDRPRFGGEAQSLEIIASYVRAMGDLEKRSKWMPTAADEELDKEPRKVKGKGRGKKGEEGTGE